MVQLPAEEERKGGCVRKMEGRRPSFWTESSFFWGVLQAWQRTLEVCMSHTPPHLHLVLKAFLLLCSASQAHSFLQGGREGVSNVRWCVEPNSSAEKCIYNSWGHGETSESETPRENPDRWKWWWWQVWHIHGFNGVRGAKPSYHGDKRSMNS